MKKLLLAMSLLGAFSAGAETLTQEDSAYGKWKKECSSCHVAYPPQMLSGDNWEQLMGKLDKHFSSNATLNAADTRTIREFLLRFAGNGDRYSSASLRISDTPWFRREHRVLAESVWTLPEVKTRSNCSACHGSLVIGE